MLSFWLNWLTNLSVMLCHKDKTQCRIRYKINNQKNLTGKLEIWYPLEVPSNQSFDLANGKPGHKVGEG